MLRSDEEFTLVNFMWNMGLDLGYISQLKLLGNKRMAFWRNFCNLNMSKEYVWELQKVRRLETCSTVSPVQNMGFKLKKKAFFFFFAFSQKTELEKVALAM